jgi:uncharacterized repeat protein (TIGR01451 family)
MALKPTGGISATVPWGERITRTLVVSNAGSGDLALEVVESYRTTVDGDTDPFGYRLTDSESRDGPTFAWVDATDGAALNLSDDGEANVTLPFPFTFYNTVTTALRVGNNGGLLVGADTGDLPYVNASLDQTALNHLMAPFWDDLDDETGAVYYKTLGTAPRRRFVIEWYKRPHYDGVGDATFEAILYEATNNVTYQYRDVTFGDPAYDDGASATVGIRGARGSYLQYGFEEPKLADELAICFQYPGSPPCEPHTDVPWLATSSSTGIVASRQSQSITLDLDAALISSPGVYTAALHFYTNDPDAQPHTAYPVTMTVLAEPPQFAIGKVASTDRVGVGQRLSYTISVTNTGGVATGGVISDPLPVDMVFAGASDDGALFRGAVVWEGLTLSDSTPLNVTYAVTVGDVPSGTRIVNDDYRVSAAEWPTPTLGEPVAVTAVVEKEHIFLPLILRSNISVP